MKIVTENQPNCLVTLRVELPADRVSKEWKKIARNFQQHARIPGYRPGKAPQSLIDTRFASDIREELTNKLLRESLNEAIKEKALNVLSVSRVEDVEIGQDQSMHYSATVVTAPEFELPDYSAISAEIPAPKVTDADIARWLDELREPHATYTPVEGRALEMGDYAVITYAGTLDGKPLAEAVPETPPQLQARRNAWLLMSEEAFLPGFPQALLGAKPDEERTITVTVPADHFVAPLQGKTISYQVTLHAINTKVVPELNDELAAKIEPGVTAEKLRENVKQRLQQLAESRFEGAKRNEAMKFLLGKVTCELPADLVQREMSGILREIVQENQVRGVSEDELRKHQDELIGAAQQSALDRVRGNFLLLRIAEKEKLSVT